MAIGFKAAAVELIPSKVNRLVTRTNYLELVSFFSVVTGDHINQDPSTSTKSLYTWFQYVVKQSILGPDYYQVHSTVTVRNKR